MAMLSARARRIYATIFRIVHRAGLWHPLYTPALSVLACICDRYLDHAEQDPGAEETTFLRLEARDQLQRFAVIKASRVGLSPLNDAGIDTDIERLGDRK